MAPPKLNFTLSPVTTQLRVSSTGKYRVTSPLSLRIPPSLRSTLTTASVIAAAVALSIWRILRSPTLMAGLISPPDIRYSSSKFPAMDTTAPFQMTEEDIKILSGPAWRKTDDLSRDGYLYGWATPPIGYRLGWHINKTSDAEERATLGRVGGALRHLGVQTMAASGHTLAVTSEGKIYSMGRDWDESLHRAGQLGRKGLFHWPAMVGGQLAGLKVAEVAVGRFHSLALTADGEVFSWGSNAQGQLGRVLANKADGFEPGKVEGELAGKLVRYIGCGRYYSMAVTDDGEVYTWGLNSFDKPTPQKDSFADMATTVAKVIAELATPRVIGGFPYGFKVIQVACGPEHWLAVSEEGDLVAASTGFNRRGLKNDDLGFDPRLGRENFSNKSPTTPARVAMDVTTWGVVVTVAASQEVSLATTSQGRLFSWGNHGIMLGRQLDNPGDSWKPDLVGKDVPGFLDLRSSDVAASDSFALALMDDGRVFSWGLNGYKQLGRSASKEDIVPKVIFGMDNFQVLKVICGDEHALLLCTPRDGFDGLLLQLENEPLLAS